MVCEPGEELFSDTYFLVGIAEYASIFQAKVLTILVLAYFKVVGYDPL